MSNEVQVDLGRLAQHALAHQEVAGQWSSWIEGPEGFVETVRRTHGLVAEPVVQALERLNEARRRYGNGQGTRHSDVSGAFITALNAYADQEEAGSAELRAAVRNI